MLELYLVRHGQTEYSRENRFCGSIDPPLSDVGAKMAQALGERYGGKAWDGIYVSPSQRARSTVAPLARSAGVEPQIEEGLREIAYGEWEGMRHEEVKAKWPDAYAWWSADVASRGTPGGETAFMVAARAALVVERVRAKHAEGRVLLVSHKATIRILVCALMGLDVRLFRDRIAQPVCAVSRFDIKPGKAPALAVHGDVSHLPPELQNEEGT